MKDREGLIRRQRTAKGVLEVLATELSDADWENIFSAPFTPSQRRVVEYFHRNHNAPTSLRTLRKELERIPQNVRENICDNLRKGQQPFLLAELREEAYEKIPFVDKKMRFVHVRRIQKSAQ